MATKICNFDFYTVSTSDKSEIAKAFASEAAIRKTGGVNNVPVFDFYARVRQVKHENKLWVGYVEKINTLDEAHIGDLGGKRETLASNDDQGPIFDTVFLYNPINNVLVLHRTRSGMGTTAFAKYLGKLVGDDDLELELVIDPDALKRLGKINMVKSIDYKISKPSNFKFLNNKNGSFNADLALAKLFQGENIKVTVGGPDLKKENVLEKVKHLLKFQDSISKLEVKGEANGEPDTIDLIQNRIVHTKRYSVSKNKKVTEVMLMDEIVVGYNKNKINLDRLYINNKIDKD
ncbi:DUF6731 family protein [Paenibacillus sp. Marseille-Q4541]|uniref:DUF6731 family protein n=1 Tax=Paenibacillus sp. Marseille-Q4541 TaxID=2831522 RepID=UPI001BA7E429|nr:DUF6731 family protein [Paenibacillus sp. Marseille-Q4541]